MTEQLTEAIHGSKDNEFVIATLHWIVQQLYEELGDQLKDIKIEVIRITYVGSYPGLGVRYDTKIQNVEEAPLIEATIDRLLQEKPVIEFLKFMGTRGPDWSAIYTRIMTEGR